MYVNDTKITDGEKAFGDYQGNEGFYYDFEDDFIAHPNGTLEIVYVYEYDFPISQWKVNTLSNNVYLTDNNTINKKEIVQSYSVDVTFGKAGETKNITVRLNYTLPDRNVIYDSDVEDVIFNNVIPIDELRFNESGVEWFDFYDNEMKLAIYAIDPHPMEGLKFNANFTIGFLDVVDGNWYEDKLVESLYNRQRSYKVTVEDGPKTLKLSKLWINETWIYYNDLKQPGTQMFSALGLTVSIENMNYSTGFDFGSGEEEEDGLPTGDEPDYPEGISIFGNEYYIWKGEIDIVTIEYETIQTLSLIVADEINNPLPGYQVNIIRGNTLFGPKMNLYDSNPIATKVADGNGQVIVYFVPRGEYTIEILNAKGKSIFNTTATTEKPLNILATNVTHFPTVIFILAGISIGMLISGLTIYRKRLE